MYRYFILFWQFAKRAWKSIFVKTFNPSNNIAEIRLYLYDVWERERGGGGYLVVILSFKATVVIAFFFFFYYVYFIMSLEIET